MVIRLVALTALAAISTPLGAQDLGGWNTPAEALPPTGPCEPPLEMSTVMPVQPDHMDWAIEALSESGSIPLTDARAQEITYGPRPDGVDPEAHPFLVRGVMGAMTGWFQVHVCGDALFVMHGSMSHEPPIPSRMPIVVWLRRQPARVYDNWVFAQ